MLFYFIYFTSINTPISCFILHLKSSKKRGKVPLLTYWGIFRLHKRESKRILPKCMKNVAFTVLPPEEREG